MTKTYGRFVAVDGLDLKVRRGEIHGFVGPNGAGKSTTIKMLVGAVIPTRGQGSVNGCPLGSVDAKSAIGYSPECPSFYKDMAAEDYLVYLALLSGMRQTSAKSRARELLGWLELGRVAGNRIGGFSAGMKQRLSIAQAMMHSPEVLILDEPTANLDPGGRMSVIEKLKNLPKEQDLTVLVSSHILPELDSLVDAATIIDRGRVVIAGTIEELRQTMRTDRGVYALDTSDNDAVFKMLRSEGIVEEIWLETDGSIHLRSSNPISLQETLNGVLAGKGIELRHFGQRPIGLEEVYRRVIGHGNEG